MVIDWFTVLAQVLNFLILVGLLRYFLYRPILDAIDQREKRIAAELRAADEQKAEADKERALFQEKNACFEQERAERLRQVEQASQVARDNALEAARRAAEDLTAKHEASLQRAQTHLYQSLQQKTATEVFAVARKALNELADAPLEEQMVTVFLQRLSTLNDAEQHALQTAFKKSDSAPVRVQTRFALSEELSARVLQGVRDVLGPDTKVVFDLSEALINGIELSTEAYQLAWSVNDYLASMEDRFEQSLC